MNLWELIFKQMRQRLLATILTCLSVALGMAMATGIGVVGREGQKVFAQSDYGFDLLVGPRGSPTQLVLNIIYHLDVAPGTIPYDIYEDLATGRPTRADGSKNPFRGMIQWAVPFAVGDSYKGRPIIGTTPQLFGLDDQGNPLPADKVFVYRTDTPFTFAQGRAFASNRFQAVIGSEVAQRTGLAVGQVFQATHGLPKEGDPVDTHPEKWTVVGILNETHTANDRALFIPIQSFYAITEHEEGLAAISKIGEAGTSAPAPPPPTAPATEPPPPYTLNADGTFNLTLPRDEWRVSAVLVKSRSGPAMLQLPFILQNSAGEVQGVYPAKTMEVVFQQFLPATSRILLLIASLVTVVAGISILVSIYNSVTARNREIAILRALGATRARILAVVCLEALLIGLIGGVLGLVGGHLMAYAGSVVLEHNLGLGIAWWQVNPVELLFLPAVIAVAFLAGLVPATKAYSISVAEHLA